MPLPCHRAGSAGVVPASLLALAMLLTSGCGAEGSSATPGVATSAPAVSTTTIAGAGVLGNQRRPDESCAPALPVATDPPGPQRIVVLAPEQLDAVCALGLQDRVVGAAVAEGAGGRAGSPPSYLGRVLHDVPVLGTAAAPDLAAITAVKPDLILGTQPGPASYPALAAIAPTVLTATSGAGWPDVLRAVGAATGQGPTADRLVDEFRTAAAQAGAQDDAGHFQASVVRLTDTTLRIYGTANFPGSVLAAAGADRPATQRFTDTPYRDIGLGRPDGSGADFSAADGDIVYVSFASPGARERATAVLDSPAWKKLSAARDNRVYAVNDEIWQTGAGIVAARGILADLRLLNAPVN